MLSYSMAAIWNIHFVLGLMALTNTTVRREEPTYEYSEWKFFIFFNNYVQDQWEKQKQDGSRSRRVEETSRRRMEAPSEGGQGPEGAVAPWSGIEKMTNVEIVPNLWLNPA
jgi:hypothetical protein